jgi:uncharacterized OsmC-like protein
MTMTMMNGVDVSRLTATIAAIRQEPEIAKFQFRLKNAWVDGGENRSIVHDFHAAKAEQAHARPFVLVNDEPDPLLGADQAPNPVEYVLHALAGCLTTSLVYHAAARGMAVEGVRTSFEGDLDVHGLLGMSKHIRRGYSQIRVSFEIDGDFSDEEKMELVKMAEAHSPVFDMVTNGVPVACALAEPEAGKAAA